MRPRFGRDRMTLSEQLELEDLLVDSFGRLRSRRTSVSPARVRALVRWRREAEPVPLRSFALFSRLAESALALAFMAFVFAGSVGPAARPSGEASGPGALDPEPRVHVSRPVDDEAFIRWVRIGRTARIFDDLDPSGGVQQVHADDGAAPAADTERPGRSF